MNSRINVLISWHVYLLSDQSSFQFQNHYKLLRVTMTVPHGSTFLYHYRPRTVEQQANMIAV